MEIASMLSENTDVVRPSESPARPSAPPPVKPGKRKGAPAVKSEARGKRSLAATRHRLAELEAYTLTLSAFFAQGELTWQKEGILGDLRQLFRVSEEHHQREMQRIWANQSLCAVARAQNAGRDNSERGKYVYDVIPEPRSPSDTESEVDDAITLSKKKKKKKKASAKPAAPSAADASMPPPTAPTGPPAPPPPPASGAPPSEKPSKVLILKKSAKKAAVQKDEQAPTSFGTSLPAAQPVPVPPAPAAAALSVEEMMRLQREREKLQEELARLAAEEEQGSSGEGDLGSDEAPNAGRDSEED